MLDTMEFLDVVWGTRRSFVDVPSKIRGHWIPFIAEWPDDRPAIKRRIASCLEDGESVYFSVAQFSSRGRRLEDTLPTTWLWADLDFEDPVFLDEDGLLPTIAWESSPGRYQAMWGLTRELTASVQTKLSRRLTYAIAADHGGYDLTQVLRPPGTKNFKYRPPGEVMLLWYLPDTTYHPREILERVTVLEKENGTPSAISTHSGGSSTSQEVDIAKLSARTRRLLKTPEAMVVVGERSARLFELECLLAEQGFEADQIVALVKPTPWNKWKGLGSEERQLRQDAKKAIRHVGSRVARSDRVPADQVVRKATDEGGTAENPRPARRTISPFVDYATFLGSHITTPRWLIEDIWSADSHGFIGGEPKVSKSTFALAMGLAVATGSDFLGRYHVPQPGPVLVIQEENAPWMVQDRLRKLAARAGLLRASSEEIAPEGSIVEHVVQVEFPPDAPLFLLNNYGFDLTDEDDRDLLEKEIIEKKAKLVILDPFYLILGQANVNSQHEIGPLLQWLTAVRYTHDCAIAVVHHWSKYNDATTHRRPGQRLLGTAIQHGWVESGIYIESEGYNEATGELTVKVEREFRNSPPRTPLSVVWKLGKTGELGMDVNVYDYNMEGKVNETIAELVAGQSGKRPVVLTAFANAMDMDAMEARRLIGQSKEWRIVSKKWGKGRARFIVSRENGND